MHRDLTAKNVLLTSSLVAKITDMGNSRIIDMRPGQMARTLTNLPGTLVYMPPEALDDRSRYGPSLDIFSFGHLALFTIIQVTVANKKHLSEAISIFKFQKFPGELLPSTFCDPNNTNIIRGRSELERREQYIKMLESLIHPLHPVLVQLVKQCLTNDPQQRPNTDELLTRLQRMKAEVEGEYGGSPIRLDMVRVRLAKEVRIKDRRIEELVRKLELNHMIIIYMTIVFVRHGEYSRNDDGRQQLLHLTEAGRAQAEAVGQWMKNICSITMIWHSHMALKFL